MLLWHQDHDKMFELHGSKHKDAFNVVYILQGYLHKLQDFEFALLADIC